MSNLSRGMILAVLCIFTKSVCDTAKRYAEHQNSVVIRKEHMYNCLAYEILNERGVGRHIVAVLQGITVGDKMSVDDYVDDEQKRRIVEQAAPLADVMADVAADPSVRKGAFVTDVALGAIGATEAAEQQNSDDDDDDDSESKAADACRCDFCREVERTAREFVDWCPSNVWEQCAYEGVMKSITKKT